MSSTAKVLPRLAVTNDTFRKYKKGYNLFRDWLDVEMWKGHRLMPATEDELDDALVEWTEQCMADDPRRGPLQDCARARQYIMLWDPKQKLGYMKNAIKGWDRLVPEIR